MPRRKSSKRKKATRVKSEQTDFFYGVGGITSGKTLYINAAHCLSMMNRKAYHQVHSDGSVKHYGLQISLFNMTNGSANIVTAPLGYPMENAVKAWHHVRKDRYKEAGYKLSDLGYGARLRFALNTEQLGMNQSTKDPANNPTVMAPFTNTVEKRGEYDFSEVVIVPPTLDDNHHRDIHADDMMDKFNLKLCGDHVLDSPAPGDSIRYETVGMIQSWVENTRGWAEPQAEDVIQPENPLAFARANSSASYMLTTEVQDEQKQAPPYSNDDDSSDQSIFAQTTISGNLETAFPSVTTNDTVVVAPGGVAKLIITNNAGGTVYPFVRVNIIEL